MRKALKYKGTYVPNVININAKAMDLVDVAKIAKLFGLGLGTDIIPVEFNIIKDGKCYLKIGNKIVKFKYEHAKTGSGNFLINFEMDKPFGPDKTEIFTTGVPTVSRSKKETIKILLDLMM